MVPRFNPAAVKISKSLVLVMLAAVVTTQSTLEDQILSIYATSQYTISYGSNVIDISFKQLLLLSLVSACKMFEYVTFTCI